MSIKINNDPKKVKQKTLTTMGLEPTIFRFEVGRLIHWATRPWNSPTVTITSDVRIYPFNCSHTRNTALYLLKNSP